MGVYYNENDRQKAATLRNLIEEGAIAHGYVDERPIQAVQPEDLAGFVQCHFFAGGGVWSYALRLAGWPDDRPVWTGSCPCGPFSVAGKKLGFEDPRHLWPEWFRLVRQCRPHRIFGEQSDAADAWIDLVSTDLEGHGYAIGSPDIPAAGFGGAHIRQRFYWVADSDNTEWWAERAPWHDGEWPKTGRVKGDGNPGNGGAGGWMANAHLGGQSQQPEHDRAGSAGGLELGSGNLAVGCGDFRGLGHAGSYGSAALRRDDGEVRGVPEAQRQPELRAAVLGRPGGARGLVNPTAGGLRLGGGGVSYVHQLDRTGAVDWLYCQDGFWRPVEPGLSPLVDATPARMGRLRLYGDAIDAEAAANFVGAYMDAAPALSEAA